MRRAALYARFSSDLQRDRSIDDQLALCREFAARQGFEVTATYDDRARSGASLFGRDGLMALMDAARAHRFEAVIVEALDRISRDQEDLAGIYKRLSHLGIDILAVHDGRADIVQVGIRGLVGALYLQDLAHKVRRGMHGVVAEGRNAGGRAYGYRPVAGKPGELEICEAEAAIVRRIFQTYVDGWTPRAIAGRLNAEKVAPPRGRHWSANTINGNLARGYGILRNRLYRGEIVWNRVRMTKDPDSGRRVTRVNPQEEWRYGQAPHLRIVEEELWERAQMRSADRSMTPKRKTRAPKRLLSGLLRCACGAGLAIHDRHRGRIRVMCSAAKEAGACGDRRKTYLDVIERAVVSGLRDQLAQPDAIRIYVETYNAERKRLVSAAVKARSQLERDLTVAKRMLDRACDAVIDEDDQALKARARLRVPEATARRDEALRALQTAQEPPVVVALHPAAVTSYLASVERLHEALTPDATAPDPESPAAALRELIEAVTVHRVDGKIELEVKGKLGALLGPQAFPNSRFAGGGCGGSGGGT